MWQSISYSRVAHSIAGHGNWCSSIRTVHDQRKQSLYFNIQQFSTKDDFHSFLILYYFSVRCAMWQNLQEVLYTLKNLCPQRVNNAASVYYYSQRRFFLTARLLLQMSSTLYYHNSEHRLAERWKLAKIATVFLYKRGNGPNSVLVRRRTLSVGLARLYSAPRVTSLRLNKPTNPRVGEKFPRARALARKS